ncbi:MAG TPA: M1 family metallopeptidase [Flavisolibacter sp.]
MHRSILVGLVFLSATASAQQSIDVLHYRFDIRLSDQHDTVYGKTTISFVVKDREHASSFNLAGRNASGKGMHVVSVTGNESISVPFRHADNRLVLEPKKQYANGDTVQVTVTYKGIPSDGLIISKNKFGDRTFFADNWPDRAHHWIPCVDMPADKASFEFIVEAPAHYQVVSNGVKISEKKSGTGMKETHWKEAIPLPTKVMVIGVARFAIKEYEHRPANIPVSAWVYPKDSTKGFYDYALAPGIMEFFMDYIGPYPFSKLANVQSTTMFGGMENASCIFYAEESVTGTRSSEELIAHEIAHQWFGDMASEKSFTHLWLSEGFATYLTDMYLEKKYGTARMQERLEKEKGQVIAFVRRSERAVVDSTTPYMQLLNANSYQKGAWVLHMLRHETGDSIFQKMLRTYYQQYKGANADTRDFQAVAEQVSGKDLGWFFNQWLYQPGIPSVTGKWKMDGDKLKIELRQTGTHTYRLPVEVAYTTASGRQFVQSVILEKETELKFEPVERVIKVILDPGKKLLLQSVISAGK